MIYLDHAATTPVPRAVADAMYEVLHRTVRQPQLPVPHGAGDEAPGGSLAEDRGGRTGL